MRTKTLLLTAAFCAAGVATSMAQVYSVNAVGYVNKTIPKSTAPGALVTYAILANPLNGTNNNISTILPVVPDGTSVFKFSNGTFENPETYFAGWDPGTATLNPGEGFFIVLDNATAPNPTTVTFVGEVPQGTLVNPIANGYSLRSSIVPQSGQLQSTLGLVPAPDSSVFTFDVTRQLYNDPFSYFGPTPADWDPAEPVIGVAEGFFILNPAASFNWTRQFSVN
jgi:hypothetical protein